MITRILTICSSFTRPVLVRHATKSSRVHTLYSENEDEQLENIEDQLTCLASSKEAADCLLLLEDLTLSHTNANYGFTLEGIKRSAESLALRLCNIDVRYTYFNDAAYLSLIDTMRLMFPQVFGDKTDAEIIAFVKNDSQFRYAFELSARPLGMDTENLSIIRQRMLMAMAKVSKELLNDCKTINHAAQKLFTIISNINARITLFQQRKLSITSLMNDVSFPDHVDIKAVYEILSNDKKNIIGFMGLAHIIKISGILKDWYDIEYQSIVETDKGSFEDIKKLLPLSGQIQFKGIKAEDFNYITKKTNVIPELKLPVIDKARLKSYIKEIKNKQCL